VSPFTLNLSPPIDEPLTDIVELIKEGPTTYMDEPTEHCLVTLQSEPTNIDLDADSADPVLQVPLTDMED
jgi:hypothetical protein